MATKKIQRKKPGYTKAGVAKIISLNLNQCNKLIAETSKPKIKAKIQNRIWQLIKRQGLPKPDVTEITE